MANVTAGEGLVGLVAASGGFGCGKVTAMPKYREKNPTRKDFLYASVDQFVSERIEIDEQYYEYSRELYEAYVAHCEERGQEAVSHRGFAFRLVKLIGVHSKVYKRRDGRTARGYHSVRLLEGVG